jgi:hypothetical protein
MLPECGPNIFSVRCFGQDALLRSSILAFTYSIFPSALKFLTHVVVLFYCLRLRFLSWPCCLYPLILFGGTSHVWTMIQLFQVRSLSTPYPSRYAPCNTSCIKSYFRSRDLRPRSRGPQSYFRTFPIERRRRKVRLG